MSTQALKNAITPAKAKPLSERTIADLMSDAKIKAQMALALPKHMTADRLARIATTEMRRVFGIGQQKSQGLNQSILGFAFRYPDPGSNRDGLLHWCLRPARLPIPPSGLSECKGTYIF